MIMNIATYATSAPPQTHHRPENTYLYYQELLSNCVSDRSTGSPRVPYSEYVQVECQDDTDDTVAQYYGKRAFTASVAQSQADPRLLEVIGEESDFSTDVGETRLQELCNGRVPFEKVIYLLCKMGWTFLRWRLQPQRCYSRQF